MARVPRRLKSFLDADIVVIGAPMYNFTIPSQLKAWLDASSSPQDFSLRRDRAKGLAGGKK